MGKRSRTILAPLGAFLALALSGCYAGAVGTALGIFTLADKDDRGTPPDVPRVFNLKVAENPPGAGRASDLSRVELSFDLFERTAEPASVTVEFAEFTPGGTRGEFLQASVDGTDGLESSDEGEKHTLFWDARADGLRGFVRRVSLRVTARDSDGEGPRITLDEIALGNTPPVANDVEVILPLDEIAAAGTVLVKFRLADDADDPSAIDLLCSLGESPFEKIPEAHVVGGQIRAVPPSLPDRLHDLTWDSSATFGGEDLENVRVAIRPDDGLWRGVGDLAESTPFCVHNSSPPEIALFPPSAISDEHGAVPLRFFLTDGESDPADVVLQWSADRSSFPDIADLRTEGLRRAVLADPDERALRGIVTPSLRTILEARCRVPGGDRADEVLLTGVTPPTAFTDDAFVGATLELLSAAGAVEQTRRIGGVDPASRRLALDRELTPAPHEGQRVRVRESVSRVLFDLRTSRGPETTEHLVVWDAPADLGVCDRSVRYFIRATAFARSRAGTSTTSAVGKRVAAHWLGLVPAAPVSTAARPSAVSVVDLNGDGRLDLVSADNSSQQLSIFLGQGDGKFARSAKQPALPTGVRPEWVEAADLDGDGHLDLVSADAWADQLSIFFGEGDGTFAIPAETLPTGAFPQTVKAADVDGDGRVDLVCADEQGNRLSIFLSRPDGSFKRLPAVKAGAPPRSVGAADLDGDGHVDLVATDRAGGNLLLLLGQGGGSFTPANLTLEAGISSVAVADLDGDGHLDIIASDSAAGELLIFLGRGGGSFARPEVPSLKTGADPRSVEVADLNGDGHLDLVSSDLEARQLSIFLGRGDASFTRPVEQASLATGRGPSFVEAGDLNGDGHLDLISVDEDGDQLSIFLGRRVRFTRPDVPVVETGNDPMSVVAADLDGDGHLDLVSPDRGSDQLSVFLGERDGSFTRVPALETGRRPVAVAAADLDGDGLLDLTSADRGANQLSVFLARGGGSFRSSGPTLATGVAPLSLAAADVDGDGHLDLVSADAGSDQLSIFRGRGDGSFATPATTLSTGEFPAFVEAADFDGDGNSDLVSADAESDQLSVFLGRGDGRFARSGEQPTLPTGARPNWVEVADLDGDGYLDLVSADSASNQLSIFLGLGDGRFTLPVVSVKTGTAPWSVDAADLDGDGYLDLVSADGRSDQLSIFLGRGDGSFTRPGVSTLDTGVAPRSVRAADLDGDGHCDLVAADWPSGPDHLSIFLNSGSNSLPWSFLGTRRGDSPTAGDARGGEYVFPEREEPYRIDSSSGTIDGERSPAFEGTAFHLGSLTIESGATVIATGANPLALLVAGDAVIAGELLCDGADAEAAGCRLGTNGNSGSAGGAGGPGGARGGSGGGTVPGSGATAGRRGGGPGGGSGGRLSAGEADPGGGGGHASRGQGDARGGGTYGNHLLEPVFGGSGGGGGSVRDHGPEGFLSPGDLGGGGGGGGGGALRVTTGGDLTVRGAITADGGDGGQGKADRVNKAKRGGHGGGGSGGSVLLQAHGEIRILPGATVSAVGGRGASGGESPSGGDGGDGRIRCEDADGVLESDDAFYPGVTTGHLERRDHADSCARP